MITLIFLYNSLRIFLIHAWKPSWAVLEFKMSTSNHLICYCNNDLSLAQALFKNIYTLKVKDSLFSFAGNRKKYTGYSINKQFY